MSWRKLNRDLSGQFRRERTPLYGPGGDGGSLEFKRAANQVLRGARQQERDFVDHQVPGMVLREEPRALVVVPRNFKIGAPEA